MRRLFVIAGALLVFGSVSAFADSASNAVAIDTMWTLVAAVLVFMMQAGFAMLETGFTRAKNAANIMMKNLMDFSIGSLAFWAVGFGVMFGADAAGLIGTDKFFLGGAVVDVSEGISDFAFWMFQVVFAATAATIVSGALAERTQFKAYLVYSVFITALIYPVVGHWIWGGGWLSNLGMIDFAGSTVVHSVGGWAGLAGAIVLGAREGKYIRHGNGTKGKVTVKAIQGHNLPLAALGVFLLWFGWFGFNAGSTVAGTDLSIAAIAVTTNLAAAAGVVGALSLAWIISGKPDPTFALNGAIAGLVAITAGTANVSPGSAVIIGFLGGLLVVVAVQFIDRVLHIDDPVGAISAHGVVGAWGTIAVGLFAQERFGGTNGLFFGGGFGQLGIQIVGVLAVFAWTFGASLVLFTVIKAVVGLRVTRDQELRGLDIEEHGAEAYTDFEVYTTR